MCVDDFGASRLYFDGILHAPQSSAIAFAVMNYAT